MYCLKQYCKLLLPFFLVENLVWFFYWYSAQDLRPVFKKHNWISINQTEFQNLRQARCDSVEFFRLFSNCLLPLYFFGCMSLGERKKEWDSRYNFAHIRSVRGLTQNNLESHALLFRKTNKIEKTKFSGL